MLDADKTRFPEKDMATEPPNFSDGEVLKTSTADKLKSRHLYMIAMGGKIDALIFRH